MSTSHEPHSESGHYALKAHVKALINSLVKAFLKPYSDFSKALLRPSYSHIRPLPQALLRPYTKPSKPKSTEPIEAGAGHRVPSCEKYVLPGLELACIRVEGLGVEGLGSM